MTLGLTRLVAILIAGLCLLAGCSQTEFNPRAPLSPLANMSPAIVVATGFVSTEGPVWHADTNSIIFSDIPGNIIYSVDVDTLYMQAIRAPSNTANGLALDAEGYLLAAEQQTRTITRMNLETGDVSAFISSLDHASGSYAFNSPNDMAIHNNGNIYFTDPPFGLRGREDQRELDFNGVFVRKPDSTIELIKSLPVGQNPNGVIFNPDQTVFYLAISHDESGPILAYDVDERGVLSNEREFARAQNADGMAMDVAGNLYVATLTGVRVWSPDGLEWGMISLPDNLRTTNVAFGSEAMNQLYITNRSPDLYMVELNTRGIQ